ncbi:MAG TPA: hypothetical protein VLM89_12265, partial [Phycisphaerae bacterium]|nr:hypothetical protein [Phycisphaerae bacterium]
LVAQVPFPLDTTVLDSVAPTQSVYDALAVLTACGLGEPMLWIRRFHQLSDGEQFRARLARAISQQRRLQHAAPLLCDEFGVVLHRRLARAISINLRRLVTREQLTLVVATSHDDLEDDLGPDTVVRLDDQEPIVPRYPDRGSLRAAAPRGIRIERGRLRDYERFAGMHYRQRDQIGFVDQVFVMKQAPGGQLLGVVVYGMPVIELRLRNRVTGGRFVRNLRRLNRELRVLKRLVIHPDVRGCGLGHRLVRRTLPRVGTRFVECLASMGAVHPVFDKAGMRRIGTVDPPVAQARTLRQLLELGADPLAADFVSQACRRPAVRRQVAEAVFNWYRRTTGGGETRVQRQSPALLANTYRQLAGSQPVYFIWAADRGGWELIDRHHKDTDGREDVATIASSDASVA